MGESPWGLRSKLTVLSANVRDLHNNIGDLTNNFILKYSADIAVATETWLDDEVEPTFGRIRGYTQWVSRDRAGLAGGGIAVCFKKKHTCPAFTGRNSYRDGSTVFLSCTVGWYRTAVMCPLLSSYQGPGLMEFLTEQLDALLMRHLLTCPHSG